MGIIVKMGLSIEKNTPNRVLFIRTAGSVIAVVLRQVIDVTAREGDQGRFAWALSAHNRVLVRTSPGCLETSWVTALSSTTKKSAASQEESFHPGGWVFT